MGGIVGRLFREFAVTVTITIAVSAVVSLTLTPMMCSRFLRHDHGPHGWLYRAVEGMFDALIGFYRRTLDIALRFQFITLLVFLGTMVVTVLLFLAIPKGFFPDQDTGVLIGISEGAQDVSFDEMSRRTQALNAVVAADPDVAAYSASIGAGLGGQTGNNGRFYISLKPFDQRKIVAAIRRLAA